MRFHSFLFSFALGIVILGCPQDQNTTAQSEQATNPRDSATAIPSPVPAENPPSSESIKNTLRWQTASEVDVFGFDILRAESEEGPFETIAADPLLGHGTTDEPHAYVFVDDTIEPGKGYWYWVEEITLGGRRSKITAEPWYAKPKGEPLPDPTETESENSMRTSEPAKNG